MFHLGVGQVATTVLTMLLSAAIGRTLGASDFGLLFALTSIATFAYVFVDWGHGVYVTREIAIHPHRAGDILGSVLVVRAATAALMCVPAFTVPILFGYDPHTRTLALLLIIAWLPQFLGLSYSWIFRGCERMEYDAQLQVVLKFSSLALAFAALALGGRVIGLIGAYAAAGVVTLIVAVVLYRRLALPRLQVTRATARELIYNGAPLMAMSLAIAVQPYITANMLYKLVTEEVLGWYGAAWTIAGTLVAPAAIIGSAMYPRLARAVDPAEFSHALRLALRPLVMLAVLGGVGTYLFADFAVAVVYGAENFGPAADTLKAFAPALVLTYIGMVLGYSILAAGKASQLAKVKFAAVVVTSGLGWVLISWSQARFANGGVGIMLATAAGELVMVGAALVMLRHVIERGMLLDALRAVAAGLATIVVMRALPIAPVVGIPVCVVTFAAMLAVTGLITRADVDMVLSRVGGGRFMPRLRAGVEPR
jgi:O-antigen/teichoic acid export membrane protein